MMKKLLKLGTMISLAIGMLAIPQYGSAQCGGSGCTFLRFTCMNDGYCGGFPARFAEYECNGTMVMCYIGCCG